MKKLTIGMFMLFCFMGATNSFAADTFSTAIWDTNVLVGYDNGSPILATQFILDVGSGREFYTMNGVISTDIYGILGAIACTGTAYTTVSGDIQIGLNCGTASINLAIDGLSLNGRVDVGNNNIDVDSGFVYFQGTR